jgi:transcriptional regulator with XRE-family HTH domain
VALLRRVIGDALRARRQGQHRTLREISTAANVSLGYLSEIERGQKEASSELLAAICEALGSQLSEVLREASDSLARAERVDAGLAEVSLTDPGLSESAPPEPALPSAGGPVPHARTTAEGSLPPAVGKAPAGTITDGRVSVSVRRDGPLRTTLHTVRARRPGQSVVRTG